MPSNQIERRLSAILSADVVGYSRLMAADEQSTVRTISAYRDEIQNLVGQHQGRVVDATGDNALAEFSTALDAVECAVAIQNELRVRNASLPEEQQMEFRIGIHLGDVTVEGERIYGNGVNIAARPYLPCRPRREGLRSHRPGRPSLISTTGCGRTSCMYKIHT